MKTPVLGLLDRTHIRFPSELEENATLLMLPILVLTLGFATFCFSSRGRIEEPSAAFEALLTIMTPTDVAWPTDYNVLFKASTSRPSMTIRIRVSNFLRNVIAGTVELKDLDDLPYLFRRQLRAYGWLVSLDADFFLRTSVLQWILVSQIPGFITKSNFYPHSSHSANVPGKNICSFYNRSCAFNWSARLQGSTKRDSFQDQTTSKDIPNQPSGRLSLERIQSTTSLDFLPYPDLETAIRTIQFRLLPGCSAQFEFTTIASNIAFLSDQFIFCCLPFMPRKYLLQQDNPCRTSTPLLASLQYITKILLSGPSSITIELITNVTEEHVTALRMIERSLVTDRVQRLGLIKKWGIEGWREHRLMIAWEAGLLSAGYLQRWNVVVRK